MKEKYDTRIAIYTDSFFTKEEIYLPESIENFITTKQMCEELKEVGLEPIFVQGYSLDMSTTFIARKI